MGGQWLQLSRQPLRRCACLFSRTLKGGIALWSQKDWAVAVEPFLYFGFFVELLSRVIHRELRERL